jgi:hypothetical protein
MQAAAGIAELEEKLATAEADILMIKQQAKADVDELVTKLNAAQADIKKQGEADTTTDSQVQTILATIPILIAQIAQPALSPLNGSLADGWLQGTAIAVEFSVVQGDRAAPACSEPGGVLKAAGLSIDVSGEPGTWKCVISGMLPSLADGEKTLEFEAVATDTLNRNATGDFTINYNANTAPKFTNEQADLGTLTDAGRKNTSTLTTLTAADAEQEASDLSFTVCDGSSLPKGVKLDAAKGTFSGEAARVGEDAVVKFIACVSDGKTHAEMEFAITILAPVCTGEDGKAVKIGVLADRACPRGCTLANPCTGLSVAKVTEEQWEMCAGSTTYQRSSISGKSVGHTSGQTYRWIKDKRCGFGSGHCNGGGYDWAPTSAHQAGGSSCTRRDVTYMGNKGTVCGFRPKIAREDAIGSSHACSA